MSRWLWQPQELDLSSFLANDDVRTGYHLQRWAEDGPADLADPCRRLLERRLPGCLIKDLDHGHGEGS